MQFLLCHSNPVWEVCFLCHRLTPCQLSKDNRHIILLLFLMLLHAKDIWRNIYVFHPVWILLRERLLGLHWEISKRAPKFYLYKERKDKNKDISQQEISKFPYSFFMEI